MRAIFLVLLFWCSPLWAKEQEPNWWLDFCVEETNFKQTQDFNELSKCTSKLLQKQQLEKEAELKDFLKANPRYRFPGQSLNRCFGKPREMPFERSTVTVGPNGMEASVWYKDKIPAGCYENAPWDNREARK